MSVAKIIASMSGIRFARFIGEYHYATTGAALDVSFTGAAAGDLALIFLVSELGVSGLSAWTLLRQQSWSSSRTDVYYKTLSAADISAGNVTLTGTGNGGVVAIAFYRGPTTPAVVSEATGSTSTLAIPGFTKAAQSQVVLTFVANGVSSGGAIAVPAGTTARVAPFGSSVISASLADILLAAAYTNGAALTWTGLSGTGAVNSGGLILELT